MIDKGATAAGLGRSDTLRKLIEVGPRKLQRQAPKRPPRV
jgi:hypothetical protein